VDGLFDDDEEHYLPVVHDPDADRYTKWLRISLNAV
jgi:hypothetical protein